MGLPQTSEQSSRSTMDAAPHPTNPTTPTQLPPEALDLATKLFNHAREGQTPPLRQYIEAGIPVNLTNHKGDTLLMLAAYHGNIETVKMLVEKGADVNGLNERGQSPVAGVVFKGYEEVVRVLVEAGADVWRGQPTAVDSARMFRRGEMLKLFGVEEEGQG